MSLDNYPEFQTHQMKTQSITFHSPLAFAPIWFPHWPAWMCTISRIFNAGPFLLVRYQTSGASQQPMVE
jgi:hypothetical protein